jgi:hypothetical protein
MTLDRNAGPDRQARLTDTPDSGTAGFQMSRCPNCSAELGFEYCPRCGQRRIHPQDLSARHYFRELADEVATFHERFKTLRTLRKLLVPGLLSAEFLAGRRQPYLTPFKVYVVCAAMFFLAAPTAGFTLASMLEADQSGTLSRLVSARPADRGLAPPFFNARFDVRVQSVYTITLGAARRRPRTVTAVVVSETKAAVRRAPDLRAALRRVHVSGDHRRGCEPHDWVVRRCGCGSWIRIDRAVPDSCTKTCLRGFDRCHPVEGRPSSPSHRRPQLPRELRGDPNDARARVTVVAGASA